MQRSRGFSLVEVMVALVITAIGLLGLAKMESLALSSTSVASGRQLAAIEASSMAAMMHANRAYWGSSVAQNTTTITGSMTAPTACTTTTSCTTPLAVAQYDEYQWSQALKAVLPNYLATITCTNSGLPITCTITITWGEAAVAVDPTKQTAMSSLNAPTYTVFVEP